MASPIFESKAHRKMANASGHGRSWHGIVVLTVTNTKSVGHEGPDHNRLRHNNEGLVDEDLIADVRVREDLGDVIGGIWRVCRGRALGGRGTGAELMHAGRACHSEEERSSGRTAAGEGTRHHVQVGGVAARKEAMRV